MDIRTGRHLFNLVGGGLIILWLVMMGLLVKRVSFSNLDRQPFAPTNTISGISSSERDWMEIYLKDKKVGYSVMQLQPAGKSFFLREEMLLNLNLMDQPTGIRTITRSVINDQFQLEKFSFKMSSGAMTYSVSGRVEGNLIFLEIGEGRAKSSKQIRFSSPPMLGSLLPKFFKGKGLELGQSFNFDIFDPSTMAQKRILVKVMAKEKVVIGRIPYNAFRLETEMWSQPIIFWVDEAGNVLKEKGFMGFTLIRSNAAKAPRNIEGSTERDFYELAAVKVEGRLRNPERLTYLKLKVEGLSEDWFDTRALGRGRQRYRSGIIEVHQEPVPHGIAYALPYQDTSGDLRAFLQPEFNIESDHNIIIDKAREIVGEGKDPSSAARKLLSWVYRNVEKRPLVAVPSALEVLKTKVGDCNEHSALLTALLRASGIPARICVGLVYARGKFFYHAWTEAYLGTWVSMDATQNQMPTDATHIKLVEGGLDKQVDLIGLIGKLSLELVDYGYDQPN